MQHGVQLATSALLVRLHHNPVHLAHTQACLELLYARLVQQRITALRTRRITHSSSVHLDTTARLAPSQQLSFHALPALSQIRQAYQLHPSAPHAQQGLTVKARVSQLPLDCALQGTIALQDRAMLLY